MNRQQAVALVLYMQRAIGIIPTTGAEWALVQGALASIEPVANGQITLNPVPVEPLGEPAPAKGKAKV